MHTAVGSSGCGAGRHTYTGTRATRPAMIRRCSRLAAATTGRAMSKHSPSVGMLPSTRSVKMVCSLSATRREKPGGMTRPRWVRPVRRNSRTVASESASTTVSRPSRRRRSCTAVLR